MVLDIDPDAPQSQSTEAGWPHGYETDTQTDIALTQSSFQSGRCIVYAHDTLTLSVPICIIYILIPVCEEYRICSSNMHHLHTRNINPFQPIFIPVREVYRMCT